MTLHHLGISDHECLSISIKTKGFYAQDVPETPIIKKEQFKYSTTDEFLFKLKSPLGRAIIKDFSKSHGGCNEKLIECLSAQFIQMITSFSKKTIYFSKRKKREKKKKGIDKQPSWYSTECYKLKASLNRTEKEDKKDPFNLSKQQLLFSRRKMYKTFCKETEQKFRKSITAKTTLN